MQELNIDDLRAQQTQNDLRKARRKAKAKNEQKTGSSVLGNLPSQSAGSENSSASQLDGKQNETQNAEQTNQQNQTAENQQQNGEESRGGKIPFWQIQKRRQTIKKLRELNKKLTELEKMSGKYKSTNFMLLAILGVFAEIMLGLAKLLGAILILLPLAVCFMVPQIIISYFIDYKIKKIKTDQKTKEELWAKISFKIIQWIIPGTTIARIRQARISAKAQFEKHQDEIKETKKEMEKLIRQLG